MISKLLVSIYICLELDATDADGKAFEILANFYHAILRFTP